MDQRPIGVFDSGLGGLTAAKALEELMPGEDLIYYGDSANPPTAHAEGGARAARDGERRVFAAL